MGLDPIAAIPMPIPMIRDSASGALKARSPPNASVSPFVVLNTPPLGSAMSWPKIKASGYEARISCSVRLIPVMRLTTSPSIGASSATGSVGSMGLAYT